MVHTSAGRRDKKVQVLGAEVLLRKPCHSLQCVDKCVNRDPTFLRLFLVDPVRTNESRGSEKIKEQKQGRCVNHKEIVTYFTCLKRYSRISLVVRGLRIHCCHCYGCGYYHGTSLIPCPEILHAVIVAKKKNNNNNSITRRNNVRRNCLIGEA